jgi:adenine-specific DNA-methyltransferase
LLIYTQRSSNFRELPNIRAYIDQFQRQITCKEVKEHKHSLYALHRARDERIFLKKKKLVGVITEDEIVLALDEKQTFVTDGLYLFSLRDEAETHYVMGILNSSLFVFIYRLLALESGRVLAQVKPTILSQLPIRMIDGRNSRDNAYHDDMVKLVAQRLEFRWRMDDAKTPPEKTSLERQIAGNDMQINDLVYKLYGLTSDEIQMIEGTRQQ